MTNSEIVVILRALIDAIESADQDALSKIGQRISSMKSVRPRAKSGKQSKVAVKIDPAKIAAIYEQLNTAESRDQGGRLLETEELTRSELVALAKLAKVYVAKADSVERVEEKLVEAIIGTRLSSAAIRGETARLV